MNNDDNLYQLEDCTGILQGFLLQDGPFLANFHQELDAEPAGEFKGFRIDTRADRRRGGDPQVSGGLPSNQEQPA